MAIAIGILTVKFLINQNNSCKEFLTNTILAFIIDDKDGLKALSDVWFGDTFLSRASAPLDGLFSWI